MNKLLIKLLVAPGIATTLLGGSRSLAYPPITTEEDGKQITQFMSAEKRGDHSLDANMIAVLQQRPLADPAVLQAAAHALARLADTDALPAFDAAASSKDILPDVAFFIRVQAARLQAESRGQGLPDGSAKAKAKVQTFLQVLDLTPQKINSDVAAYNKTQTYPVPLALTASVELADMIYHGTYRDYASLPSVQQVDFKQNSYTNLLMHLAPMSQKDRIAAMVKDLTADKKWNADAELRLAADEGVAAGQAAIAQIGRMDQNRAGYSQESFHTLFRLIRYTQPPEIEAVRARYKTDADTKFAEDALAYLQP